MPAPNNTDKRVNLKVHFGWEEPDGGQGGLNAPLEWIGLPYSEAVWIQGEVLKILAGMHQRCVAIAKGETPNIQI